MTYQDINIDEQQKSLILFVYSLLLVVVVLKLAPLPVHRVPAVRLRGVLRGPLRGGGRGLAAAVAPVPGVGRAGGHSHITPAVQNTF